MSMHRRRACQVLVAERPATRLPATAFVPMAARAAFAVHWYLCVLSRDLVPDGLWIGNGENMIVTIAA